MSFFRLWTTIVVCGALFALFFLPLMLSFCGPAEEANYEEEDKVEVHQVANHKSHERHR